MNMDIDTNMNMVIDNNQLVFEYNKNVETFLELNTFNMNVDMDMDTDTYMFRDTNNLVTVEFSKKRDFL